MAIKIKLDVISAPLDGTGNDWTKIIPDKARAFVKFFQSFCWISKDNRAYHIPIAADSIRQNAKYQSYVGKIEKIFRKNKFIVCRFLTIYPHRGVEY